MRIIDHWIKRCLFGYCETLWLDRLRIYGTSEFQQRTTQALGLLEAAGYSDFVATNLNVIRQGLRSTGYILPRASATYVIGEFTWKLSPAGYASMIAHHALRKSAYENIGGSAVTSTEFDCLCFQETVLEKLQATDEEFNEATGLTIRETGDLLSAVATKERQTRYAEDHKRRYGLCSILPDSWFYCVAEHRGIRIRGSEEFIAHSCRALDLLAKIPEWSVISENIRSIKQSTKSRTYIRTGGKKRAL